MFKQRYFFSPKDGKWPTPSNLMSSIGAGCSCKASCISWVKAGIIRIRWWFSLHARIYTVVNRRWPIIIFIIPWPINRSETLLILWYLLAGFRRKDKIWPNKEYKKGCITKRYCIAYHFTYEHDAKVQLFDMKSIYLYQAISNLWLYLNNVAYFYNEFWF